MKIILLQDIKSLGRRGDIKNVADGYARNFLLPRNLVKPATGTAIQELEVQKAKLEKQLEGMRVELENVQKATAAEPLIFQVKVGEKGEIFGSVTASEIKNKLLERYPSLEKTDLKVEANHLKELGKQEIGVKSERGLEGRVTIEIIPSTKTV